MSHAISLIRSHLPPKADSAGSVSKLRLLTFFCCRGMLAGGEDSLNAMFPFQAQFSFRNYCRLTCKCYKSANLGHTLFRTSSSSHSFDLVSTLHLRNHLGKTLLLLIRLHQLLCFLPDPPEVFGFHSLLQHEDPGWACSCPPGPCDANTGSICDDCHRIRQFQSFLYAGQQQWIFGG